MSQPTISSYTFLPWARQGLGLQLTQSHGDTSVKLRGSVPVNLKLSGEKVVGTGRLEAPPIDRSVQLYGPGDIVGIHPASIVRSEPRPDIANFESNYLAFVEFYDEDFCWRYTPAKASADGRYLRPWLTLLVLEDGEFSDLGTPSGHPLPSIRVSGAGVFPAEDTLWAWAHVHVDAFLGGDPNDTADQAGRLGATVRDDRDSAYSRLVSPRRLKANTGYTAFVVPSFEAGRVAGLGLPRTGVGHATQSSWAGGRLTAPLDEYPVYHRWHFRTGSVGDFEYLVRLLKPRTVDPRVGRRDIDLLDPHASVPKILGPANDGVLRLGGALRAPLATLSEDDRQEYDDYEQWPGTYPHPFQTAVAAFVNLGADYAQLVATDANSASALPGIETDEDPLITPPLYSRWHSQTTRLEPPDQPPEQENKWVDELNLDPRHRTAAGFGTEVVRRGQESYTEAAWQQVGKVLEGNTKIRYAQLARLATYVWYRRELKPVAADGVAPFLAITSPVQRRVLSEGLTVSHRVKESTVPTALHGTTMRKALRPRARVDRLVGFTEQLSAGTLLDRVNSGEVSPAPPKQVPGDLPTSGRLADRLPGKGLPDWLAALLRRFPRWRWVLIVIALVLAALLLWLFSPVVGAVAAVVLVGGALALAQWLARGLARHDAADVLSAETRTPDSVDELGTSSDFTVAEPGAAPRPTPGGADSEEAVRFKQALRNLYAVDQAERSIQVPTRRPLDLGGLALDTVSALDPGKTIPARVFGSIEIPPRIKDAMVEDFGEVMVYPEIDDPMYKPLIGLSDEHFVPNLNLVEVNSITLLETNQEFIEAYLVGLNHEFARELLWREYPTDQRGSYFRQFWDVTGYLAAPGADPVQVREELRDIPELHTWSKDKDLGSFDHREQAGEEENEVVLVIRGELLAKYPTAVIYAHRAEWTPKTDGTPDKTKPRRLVEPPSGGDPGRTVVKTPLYEAKVDPDIYFFGFDLTAEEAKGGQQDDGSEDPGWFFVIKERPGEPRFGLDLPGAPQPSMNTWNQLAWSDVAIAEGSQLAPGSGRTISLVDPGAASDAKAQYDEDRRHQWRPDTTAAEIAYILYQVPVLMAVHAAEMLVKPEADDA